MMQSNATSGLVPDAFLDARVVHELITVVVDVEVVVVAAVVVVVVVDNNSGGAGGLIQDVEVVVMVLLVPGRQAAVVVSDHVLEVRNVRDGHAQGLHLGQPLVPRLVRHVLPQAQEGRVHRLHATSLTRVPLGHQVHGLESVRHVLVHRFLAVGARSLASRAASGAGGLPRGLAGR